MILFEKWEDTFKTLRIYGEPNIEYTVKSGKIEEKTVDDFIESTCFD